jgi:AcrR family transcriptional regulator
VPKNEVKLRRPPKQDRSRERVEEILSAAKRLIGEKGIDAVKMREIAAVAGGPISSIYQYFPNKTAIILTLYSQWSAEIMGLLTERLESIGCVDDLYDAACGMLDYYYERISSDPAILDLLNAIQADKALKNIDIADTRIQAQMFCERGRSFIPEGRFVAFERVAFLMFQLANGAVRLAMTVNNGEVQGILMDYKSIIRTQLSAFAKGDPA